LLKTSFPIVGSSLPFASFPFARLAQAASTRNSKSVRTTGRGFDSSVAQCAPRKPKAFEVQWLGSKAEGFRGSKAEGFRALKAEGFRALKAEGFQALKAEGFQAK
jgi:hypothetical protein